MSAESVVIAFALTSSILGSAAIGYWFGYRRHQANLMEASRAPSPATGAEWALIEARLMSAIAECTQSSRRLHAHSSKLRLMAFSQDQPIAPLLMQQIERLAAIAESLMNQLDSIASPKRPQPSHAVNASRPSAPVRLAELPRTPPAVSKPSHDTAWLTSEEFALISVDHKAGERSQSSQGSLRHVYECEQFMAPWNPGESMPTSADFMRVKCHDISRGGISFVLANAPDFDTLLITVGTKAHSMIMAAKVVHSHSVFMYGDIGYLVGCEFLQRIGIAENARQCQTMENAPTTDNNRPATAANV